MASMTGAQSQLLPGKSVHSIILDTSPILNSIPSISTLLAECEKLYTVPAIIDEIKDVNARSRLQTMILPFLTIKTPKPESIKFVSDFSRKTGDYLVLSKPDVQVLALAYELDCEQNGGDCNLRKAPGQKGFGGSPPESHNTAIEGSGNTNVPLSGSRASSSTEETDVLIEPSATSVDELQISTPASAEEVDAKKTTRVTERLQIVGSNSRKLNFKPPHGEPLDLSNFDLADPESESDNSDGWINPSNLKKQQAKDGNASIVPMQKDQIMQVATITTDFAMQVST